MKGKIGLIVGVGIGYVLGTRAGRERYEQIKEAATKLWETDPVQTQVARVSAFARSSALAVPKTLWNGAVKVTKAVAADGSASQRAQRGFAATEHVAEDVADDIRDAAHDADTAAKAVRTPARKPAARRSAKPSGTTKRSGTTKSSSTKKD